MDYESEQFYTNSSSTVLNFTSDQIKIKESHKSAGYGIRVYKNKKLGFSYCQEEKNIPEALNQALSSSKFSPSIEFTFPRKKDYQLPAHTFDKKLENIPIEKMKDILYSIKNHAETNSGKSRIFLASSFDHKKLENSSGFSGEYKSTSFSIYVEVMNESGFGFEHIALNHLPNYSKLGEFAAKMAKDMKSAEKPKSGHYKVVFEPIAFENILDTLLPSFSGDFWRRKITKLKKDEKVFSDKLTILEDPLAKAINCRPFDDEGTILDKPIPLVKNGVVKNFCFDNETLALSNKPDFSPGFCFRDSYSTPPSIGHSNIVIRSGDYSDFETELGEHLVIYSAHGSHTANVTTGELGLEVSNACLVKKNGDKIPMRGFMLSMNIFDVLNHIIGLEKPQHTYLNVIAPRIAFENIQVV